MMRRCYTPRNPLLHILNSPNQKQKPLQENRIEQKNTLGCCFFFRRENSKTWRRKHIKMNSYKNVGKEKNKLQIAKHYVRPAQKNCPCKFIFGISILLSALSALSFIFIYLYTNHAHIEFPSNPSLTQFYSSTLHSRAMCPAEVKGRNDD